MTSYNASRKSTTDKGMTKFPIPDSLQRYGAGDKGKERIGMWLSKKLAACDASIQEKVHKAYSAATHRSISSAIPVEALMHIMPTLALNANDRFTLVESIIKACHVADEKDRAFTYSDPLHHAYTTTFDKWNNEKSSFRKKIRNEVVEYYNSLDFVKRYHLDCFMWTKDADIRALLQILQAQGRAKAAARLEKFESELDGISDKIAKLESGGRYYREDAITITIKFDKLEFVIKVINDRPKKRQEKIEKIAAAPGKAVEAVAEGTLVAADKAFSFGCALLFIIGIILTPIMLILHFCGVVK